MHGLLESVGVLPAEFWCVVALLAGGLARSVPLVGCGIGVPMMVALLTVSFWYVGDALYNGYARTYVGLFSQDVLATAWWQVAVFVAMFTVVTPPLHAAMNRRYLHLGSQVVVLCRNGVRDARFQAGLNLLFRAALGLFVCLLGGGVLRFGLEFPYFLFPYLGKHPGPWVTNGLGSGADSLLALANYLELLVGSLFGVIAALSTTPRIRRLAAIGVLLVWPYYVLDRTRKYILVIVVPGACAWVMFRVRGGALRRGALAVCMALAFNAWFGFIIGTRSASSVTSAFLASGFRYASASAEEHQGLNMYEELAWITALTSTGQYSPTPGANYFANLVNPVPRAVWPGKPTIGLDYAIARGLGGADTEVGVYATLSSGVVGQGVVNFGLYLGPAVAALLIGLWSAWLARVDLRGSLVGHVPLYGLGLILTFNMGREVTFLEAYPFCFGVVMASLLQRRARARHANARQLA